MIKSYLDEVDAELDAVARLMVPPPNRLAAFHLQQAAEKLTKALRLSRGLAATTEHRIALLIEDLADSDPWKAALLPLDRHSLRARRGLAVLRSAGGGRAAILRRERAILTEDAALNKALEYLRIAHLLDTSEDPGIDLFVAGGSSQRRLRGLCWRRRHGCPATVGQK
ncbi:MAG: HEPN domain-containing protein [Polyangiaceae bacterium]|jgi:hypothetical protein|nr:HEPN domain-containing protein [Polyangiaceae bacterium]